MCFSVKTNNLNTLSYLDECFSAIKKWISSNFMLLNSGETEVLVFGHESLLMRPVGSLVIGSLQ